jgi:hypothetical protein
VFTVARNGCRQELSTMLLAFRQTCANCAACSWVLAVRVGTVCQLSPAGCAVSIPALQ